MKKTRSSLTVGITFAGLCISAWLVVSGTVLADEKAEDILTKLATSIKDIANLQELEEKTFHVINITEHDSVLPAELRLAGKESDWAEGIIGYVDGKEVPTGLMPGGNYVRLMVLVPLKPKEVKKVTFKKGKGTVASDLKVEHEGSRVVVSNRQAIWKLSPNGMEQFQMAGKTFVVQEADISNGTLKTILTPAVCRVTLQAAGGGSREYLFYPRSPLWRVEAEQGYKLSVGGSNTFHYAHSCGLSGRGMSLAHRGDGPTAWVIDTTKLQKGGMKVYHLMRATEFGLMMGETIGLGVYPSPGSNVIKVDMESRPGWTVVSAVSLDKQEQDMLVKWHCFEKQAKCNECWPVEDRPLAMSTVHTFGLAGSVVDGLSQRSAALSPLVFVSAGDNRHSTQPIWNDGSTNSISMLVADSDCNGPDMLNDRWYCLNNGRPSASYEFLNANKDNMLDSMYVYSDWDKNQALDSMELQYPSCVFHDQTHDGKIVPNCLLFGGQIAQDWMEFSPLFDNDNKYVPFPLEQYRKRTMALGPKKFISYGRALDLDNDGDFDAGLFYWRYPQDTYYDCMEYRQFLSLDLFDKSGAPAPRIDPFSGDFFGFRPMAPYSSPIFSGNYSANFIYKGIGAGAQNNGGPMCLDGDGLPEGHIFYDAGLIEDFIVFRPTGNMMGSIFYLSNRHTNPYDPFVADLALFPIRQKTHYPFSPRFPNTHLMPQRSVKDATVTYRDKWGNEVQIATVNAPRNWDGKLLNCAKDPDIAGDWRESMHYDWDYMLAGFEGICGGAGESGYASHCTRWEFCPDYARRRKAELYYSELDGRLHFKGAAFGHATPYQCTHPKKEPIDALTWRGFIDESWFCLDCDTMRYYSNWHEAFFDEDGDGYLDCFIRDMNNDGWYEKRVWYDRAGKAVDYMENDILVRLPYSMKPYTEEEVLLENYDKLVALKRMSEEQTPFLKKAFIKAEPLSIVVTGAVMWVGFSSELLPQVLLDTAHGDTNLWRDLSPKGYSRLLTGLQRQKAVVRELREKWSDETLRDASILFVAPLQTVKPEPDELKALDSFLKRGGRCVVIYPDCPEAPEAVAYAQKTDKPLTPGGKTEEWTSPQGIDLSMRWEVKSEAYDVKIKIYPKWDQTYFYLYAEIQDRDLINKGTGAGIWEGDCIQFALADFGKKKWQWTGDFRVTGNDEKEMADLGGRWQEYGIARTAQGPQVYRWIDVPLNLTGPAVNAKVEVMRREDRTIYQLALPWTEFGKINIAAGAELGFSLVVWDRIDDKKIDKVNWGGGIADGKDPAKFRKLRLIARNNDRDDSPGFRINSHTDTVCAPYGISRKNEHIALMSMVDPVFTAVFQDKLASEVWSRFSAGSANNFMQGVRKLYFNGYGLAVRDGAEPLISYQDKIIGARTKVGEGELLAFCSETMLNNSQACFHSFGGVFITSRDTQGFDTPLRVKPDNNVFMDNLAKYVVVDQEKIKIEKTEKARMMVELAVPGKVYVNKGTKIAPGGKEAINGKENGDTMCFEIPVSKSPIKLKISR